MNVNVTALRQWADELGTLEDQLEAIQEAKKQVYARIRRDHSRLVAEGIKGAMRLLRMEPRAREERQQFAAEPARYFRMLSSDGGSSCLARENGAGIAAAGEEVWRAARMRERAESCVPSAPSPVDLAQASSFDPETGEILEAEADVGELTAAAADTATHPEGYPADSIDDAESLATTEEHDQPVGRSIAGQARLRFRPRGARWVQLRGQTALAGINF